MRLSTDWKIERLEIYLNKTLMSENVKRQQTSLRCLFMHSQFLLTNLSKSMMLLAVIGPGQSQNKDYLISASSSFIFDTIWKSFYTKCLKLYGAKSVIIRVTRTVICIPFCVKWLRRTTVWLEVMSTGSFSCMVQKLLPITLSWFMPLVAAIMSKNLLGTIMILLDKFHWQDSLYTLFKKNWNYEEAFKLSVVRCKD